MRLGYADKEHGTLVQSSGMGTKQARYIWFHTDLINNGVPLLVINKVHAQKSLLVHHLFTATRLDTNDVVESPPRIAL